MSAEAIAVMIAIIVAVVLMCYLIPRKGCGCARRRPCGHMHAHTAYHTATKHHSNCMHGSGAYARSRDPTALLRQQLNGSGAFKLDPPREEPLRLSSSSSTNYMIPDIRQHTVREYTTVVS